MYVVLQGNLSKLQRKKGILKRVGITDYSRWMNNSWSRKLLESVTIGLSCVLTNVLNKQLQYLGNFCL